MLGRAAGQPQGSVPPAAACRPGLHQALRRRNQGALHCDLTMRRSRVRALRQCQALQEVVGGARYAPAAGGPPVPFSAAVGNALLAPSCCVHLKSELIPLTWLCEGPPRAIQPWHAAAGRRRSVAAAGHAGRPIIDGPDDALQWQHTRQRAAACAGLARQAGHRGHPWSSTTVDGGRSKGELGFWRLRQAPASRSPGALQKFPLSPGATTSHRRPAGGPGRLHAIPKRPEMAAWWAFLALQLACKRS